MKLESVFAAVAAVTLVAASLVPTAFAADDDDIIFLRPEHSDYTAEGDDDDIVILRPEYNPLTEESGVDAIFVICDGEPTSCSSFETVLFPEPAPAEGDFDHDGIKDYWDPDDDNCAGGDDEGTTLPKDYWDDDDDSCSVTSPFGLLRRAAKAGADRVETKAMRAALARTGATQVRVLDVDDVWPAETCTADLDDVIWAAQWLYGYAASFVLPDGTKITARDKKGRPLSFNLPDGTKITAKDKKDRPLSFMLPDGTKITADATSTSAGLLLVLNGTQGADAFFLEGPLACAE